MIASTTLTFSYSSTCISRQTRSISSRAHPPLFIDYFPTPEVEVSPSLVIRTDESEPGVSSIFGIRQHSFPQSFVKVEIQARSHSCSTPQSLKRVNLSSASLIAVVLISNLAQLASSVPPPPDYLQSVQGGCSQPANLPTLSKNGSFPIRFLAEHSNNSRSKPSFCPVLCLIPQRLLRAGLPSS